MKSGTCPKCQSTEILRAPRGAWHGLHQLHISWAEAALVECLVCAQCGFVEPYVNRGVDLRKLRRAYERYRPRGRRAPKESDEPGDSGASGHAESGDAPAS